MTKEQKRDIKLLAKFTEVYCNGKHQSEAKEVVDIQSGAGSYKICKDCKAFLEYAVLRRTRCPLEAEKPTCKHCKIHCYAPEQRKNVREIMGYAGRKLLLRGRVDYLWHYFF